MLKPRSKSAKKYDYGALILSILAPFEAKEEQDGVVRCRCPHNKLRVNPRAFRIHRSGKWRCYSCNTYGDITKLLMDVRKLTFQQAKEIAADTENLPVLHSLEDLPVIPAYAERHAPKTYPWLRDASIATFIDYCPEYLRGRGFSERVIRRYEIGYDVSRHKIVIPVRDVHKKIVGLTYRTDFDGDKDQPSKYWHDNFDKSAHLYGFHLHVDEPRPAIAVTEGQLDTCRLSQLGLASVAVMGSDMSNAQLDLLVRHAKTDRVILAFDNDEPGETATRKTIQMMMRTRFRVGLSVLVYDGKDPGELLAGMRMSTRPWHRYLVKPGGIYSRSRS